MRYLHYLIPVLVLANDPASAQTALPRATETRSTFDQATGFRMPADWKAGGSAAPTTFNGMLDASRSTIPSGIAWYVLTDTSNTTRRAFGVRRASSTAAVHLRFPFVNDSSEPIHVLDVRFKVWQATRTTRNTGLRLDHYFGRWGETVKTAGLTSETHTSEVLTEGAEVLAQPIRIWKRGRVVFPTPIAPGDSAWIGFSFIQGDGSGNNAHLGLEEVRIRPNWHETLATGPAGWRTVAFPFAGALSDLGGSAWVQGVAGGPHAGATPNWRVGYDGSDWGEPAAYGTTHAFGTGWLRYRYASESDTIGGYGVPATADVDIPLHADGDGWNLLGNPFDRGFLANALGTVVQVWHPAESTWVLSSDPVLAGKIAPWQGFMLHNGGESPRTSVTIPLSARSDGATLLREPTMPVALAFRLEERMGDAWVVRDRSLVIGRDSVRLPKLPSLLEDAAWVAIAAGQRLAQADARTGPFDLDMRLPRAGTWRLAWERPDATDWHGWVLRLDDLEDGVESDLWDSRSYGFTAAAGETLSRFRLRLTPPAEVSTPGTEPLPSDIRLMAAYPNPFNPSTEIGYQISVFGNVRLAVYDVLGREVVVLADGPRAAGTHQVRLDARGWAAGVYVVRLEAAGHILTRSITLIP